MAVSEKTNSVTLRLSFDGGTDAEGEAITVKKTIGSIYPNATVEQLYTSAEGIKKLFAGDLLKVENVVSKTLTKTE